MSKEYYILSVKHTQNRTYHQEGLVVTWWKPDNSGYTVYLEAAGRYPEEIVNGNLSYYDNKKNSIAIPCERAEEIAYRCVPWENQLLKQIGVTV